MFIGSVPKQSVQQLLTVSELTEADRIYVCCSGQFRVESVLREQFPSLFISGNDVSLLSCALGCWLTGSLLPFRFIGDLAPLEDITPVDPRWRLAALLLALDLTALKRSNAFGLHQWQVMIASAESLLASLHQKLERYASIRINDFFAGDLREQARRATEDDGIVLAFTPTYKGGYERAYKALMQSVEWDAPDYSLWDNYQLPDFLRRLEHDGTRYYAYSDHPLDGFRPIAKFERGHGRTVWLYGRDQGVASLRAETVKARPFAFNPVDAACLTAETSVSVLEIDTQRFNFLRERYLSRSIDFVNGNAHFLVMLGNQVAGGIAYQRAQYGDITDLYLLSDFSVSRERRLSKLIALLATSRDLVRRMERVYGQRFNRIYTTAFTDKPVSMKYRGAFEVSGRKPGLINYVSPVRSDSVKALYSKWWTQHAKNAR